MSGHSQPTISLRRWQASDLPLLERLLGDPAMTQHIGGPETPEQLRRRLERYCQDSAISHVYMFVIQLEPAQTGIGSIGFWERAWQGEPILESGWRILPEHQGQGIATQSLNMLLELARDQKSRRYLHAFPAVDNLASNVLCKKSGFHLQSEVDFEYPPGHFMRSNDWRFDLFERES